MAGSKLKVFVLKESEWLNPNTVPDRISSMWDAHAGRGCCLGLCALSESVPVEYLENRGTPSAVVSAFPMERRAGALPQHYRDAWLTRNGDSTYWSTRGHTDRAMEVNDARDWENMPHALRESVGRYEGPVTLEERVAALRPIFREAGYILRFIPSKKEA